ncbi:MAG: hypothetical protein IK100_06145 [Muribaculaceae bacterium]|nr:hypothetical protein [Muribaculaceae bacterium]
MATQLITTDQQLLKYLPNAFATAQGEAPFFEKVLPWLEAAERWTFSQFIGNAFLPILVTMDENHPLRMTTCSVVAHEAMMRAVPSLDLVLTPNGFGIVSNSNVAPASRDRVIRLVKSLEESRDIAIEQMLQYLFQDERWYATSKRRWFTATLFPNIDLASLCGFPEKRWANYLALRLKAVEVEQRIAEEYISPEQMDVLRGEVIGIDWTFTLADRLHLRVIEQLRAIVVDVLKGNLLNIQALRDIVDLMRKNEEIFAEFANSDTAKLFTPPIFENKKRAHGYWF